MHRGVFSVSTLSELYDNKVLMVYLPVVQNYGPFVYKVDSKTAVTLVGASYVTDTSTATVTIQHNGSNIAALTGLSITSTASFTSASVAIADGDTFNYNATAVGVPNILSVGLVLQVKHS